MASVYCGDSKVASKRGTFHVEKLESFVDPLLTMQGSHLIPGRS